MEGRTDLVGKGRKGCEQREGQAERQGPATAFLQEEPGSCYPQRLILKSCELCSLPAVPACSQRCQYAASCASVHS